MASCRADRFSTRPSLLLCVAFALVGCGGNDTASVPTPPAPAPPAPVAPEPAKPPAKLQPTAGLTPLATPQQVVSAIDVGRPDPFAPSQSTGTIGPDGKPVSGPAKAALPDGFKLTGLIRSGGRSQAFVQIGSQSGPLCPGPRGRCSGTGADQPLLPPGWTVTGIDATNGLLAVSFGRQRQVISLAP
ncbi:MAG: hypothetical protein RLZZ423_1124 [Cyanobacteriota bacterium]